MIIIPSRYFPVQLHTDLLHLTLRLNAWQKRYRRPLVCGAALLALFAVLTVSAAFAPAGAGEAVRVTIPGGSTADEIAAKLSAAGIVRNSAAFALAVRWYGQTHALQAGTYELKPGMTMREIIQKLSAGQVVDTAVRVTIPEGATLPDMGRIFAQAGLFTQAEFLSAAENIALPYEYLAQIPANTRRRLEGYLFPDTYEFHPDATPELVIRTMLARFHAIVPPLFAASPKRHNFNLHQIVTMASIVEREAAKSEERPRIAGVFYNRLRRGMLLQSCATVQFVIGRPGKLYYVDLEVESPYNTYIHAGLPPGPIAGPGLASLKAALAPEDTAYLFFVARGDGSHIFSRTYAEHRLAIQAATRR
jgi:UPF0755 protein